MDGEFKEAFEAVCKYTYEVANYSVPPAYDRKPQPKIMTVVTAKMYRIIQYFNQ